MFGEGRCIFAVSRQLICGLARPLWTIRYSQLAYLNSKQECSNPEIAKQRGTHTTLQAGLTSFAAVSSICDLTWKPAAVNGIFYSGLLKVMGGDKIFAVLGLTDSVLCLRMEDAMKSLKRAPGTGFWIGTCVQCGSPITRRNSVGLPVLKQVGRLKRQCRNGCSKKTVSQAGTVKPASIQEYKTTCYGGKAC